MVKFLLDVANVLQIQFRALMDSAKVLYTDPSGATHMVKPVSYCLGKIVESVDPVTKAKTTICQASGVGEVMANFGTALFLIILFVGVIIALLYLTVILVARVVVVKFLIIVAPVAFILGIMPFTEFLEKRWWSEMFKWVFMGPAVAGTLLIAAVITQGIPVMVSPMSELTGKTDIFAGMIGVVLAAIAYYLAAQIPSMMGGEGMKLWDKVAKKGVISPVKAVGKAISDRTYGRAKYFMDQRGAEAKRRREAGVDAFRAKLAQKGWAGQKAAGVDEKGMLRLKSALIKNYGEEAGAAKDAAELRAGYDRAETDLEKTAWAREITKRGLTGRVFSESREAQLGFINKWAEKDSEVFKNALDEETDLALLSSHEGLSIAAGGKLKKQELKGLKGKEIKALNEKGMLGEFINEKSLPRVWEQGAPDTQATLKEVFKENQDLAHMAALLENTAINKTKAEESVKQQQLEASKRTAESLEAVAQHLEQQDQGRQGNQGGGNPPAGGGQNP